MGRQVDTDDLIDAHGVADLLGLAQRNTVSLYQPSLSGYAPDR